MKEVVLRVPGDKSISHRALLLSALAEGESRLRGLLPGEDPRSTAATLRALGVDVPPLPPDGAEVRVRGVGLRGLRPPSHTLDCANSGTTARLLLGVLAGQRLEAELDGDASLRRRPMARVTEPLARMGATFVFGDRAGRLPLRIRGGSLEGIRHDSPRASAQVKSAVLLAGLTGGVEVSVTEPTLSRDHTERLLSALGCDLERSVAQGGRPVARLRPPATLSPLDLDVPGDFSSAAFLLALGLLLPSGAVRLRRVGLNPTRTGLLGVLERMGARIQVEEEGGAGGEPKGALLAEPSVLVACEVGPRELPSLIDEVPVVAILGARARGETRIHGAGELRLKETDRLSALAANLRLLGVDVEELPDGLAIEGRPGARLAGRVEAYGDHRIAMAFGVLGALPGNAIEVDAPEVVGVSYPEFWRDVATVVRGVGAA